MSLTYLYYLSQTNQAVFKTWEINDALTHIKIIMCLKFYIIKKSKDIRIREKGNYKPILWVSGNTRDMYFTCDSRECYRHA